MRGRATRMTSVGLLLRCQRQSTWRNRSPECGYSEKAQNGINRSQIGYICSGGLSKDVTQREAGQVAGLVRKWSERMYGGRLTGTDEIGGASCRERGWREVWIA